MDPHHSYRPFPPITLPDRTWPNQVIRQAPVWCSVDLRDGNQALIEPMGVERKRRMWDALVEMGFKQIEVGFPSASQADHDFVRDLVDNDRIPDDVTIQVLTQARDELIDGTFAALAGVPRAIVHMYNSTSPLQRRVVFQQDKAGITDIAVRGAERVLLRAQQQTDCDVHFQYSPESFSATEIDYSVEICEAVMDVWQPIPERPVILNLPATVEMSTPNVHADQIELFGRMVRDRDSIVLSVHPHNDRGCAVAAAELAVMAGADRIEGTLFGNGERTGNVDIVTLALNLMSQGIDPELQLSDINHLVRVSEHCTRLTVHPRHPYAGDLVFTAFSGSHQDAIKKGLAALGEEDLWEVPYLPLDPAHVDRTYEEVIRINSQSGKGGIAFILEQDYGLQLPRRLQVEFRQIVKGITDETEEEVSSKAIWDTFAAEYLGANGRFQLVDYREAGGRDVQGSLEAVVSDNGVERTIQGQGSGPIDAFVDALKNACEISIRIVDYHEHAVGSGTDAKAAAYVEVMADRETSLFGVGIDHNIVEASLEAVISAVNRSQRC
jgi:2-isopropylmalate synthase